mmetsp:Transcript_9763/g.16209  ORF Transcript_9763/g.16209 Transcript_9763/m.16209 type:complete len:475 (+) Transcript_9763:117-1541(+)
MGTMVSELDLPEDGRESDATREVVSNQRVVYLTARPLRHLQETKRFISGVSEGEQLLPAGPLFCNKVGQLQALYGEMVGTTAEFKGQLLQDIEHQFIRVGRGGDSPLVLGIGNKDTDAQAYQMCNIRLENIFIVQKSSSIHCHVQHPRPVETLPSDQEVLTQLQSLSQQGDSAPSTNFVGKAIVENTLNSFSSTQSHRIDRSHGVDLKALTGDAGEQKAQKTSSARPTFLPGDNGGLVIEGEGNSVVTPSAEGPRTAFDGISTYPVRQHIFSGYDDPVLLQYCEHLLMLHHQAPLSRADLFCPFEFPPPPPPPPQQQVRPGHSRADAGRARSLSDDDVSIAMLPPPQPGRRSLFTKTKSTSAALGDSSTRKSDLGVGKSSNARSAWQKPGGKLRMKLLGSRSRSPPAGQLRAPVQCEDSDMSASDNLAPPVLGRVCSEPMPQRDSIVLSGRSTAKGVKLSQMTDFFNSEQYADV